MLFPFSTVLSFSVNYCCHSKTLLHLTSTPHVSTSLGQNRQFSKLWVENFSDERRNPSLHPVLSDRLHLNGFKNRLQYFTYPSLWEERKRCSSSECTHEIKQSENIMVRRIQLDEGALFPQRPDTFSHYRNQFVFYQLCMWAQPTLLKLFCSSKLY